MQKTCRVSRFYISKPRFGYKNSKKLHFLVIPRGKELDHRNWTYDDRAFEQLSGSEMGGI